MFRPSTLYKATNFLHKHPHDASISIFCTDIQHHHLNYSRGSSAMAQGRTAIAALCLIALGVAAASLPAASAYGCYDDCYERCANGKDDPTCTKMCTEACGAQGGVAPNLSVRPPLPVSVPQPRPLTPPTTSPWTPHSRRPMQPLPRRLPKRERVAPWISPTGPEIMHTHVQSPTGQEIYRYLRRCPIDLMLACMFFPYS